MQYMATSLSTPTSLQTFLCTHKFSNLNRCPFITSPQSSSLPSSCSSSFNLSEKALGFLPDHSRHAVLKTRRFTTTAASTNGSEPRHYDFDMFTIGAGSGGVKASLIAANYGASVAVCELPYSTLSSETTGGLGGTVLKKLLVYASKYAHDFEESLGFGWSYNSEPTHDWSTLMANTTAELERLTGVYKNDLNNAGVKMIQGCAKIVDPHTVDVDGKRYTARNILVSLGGQPFVPDIPGREYVIDSDVALDLPSKPKKLAIIGGGHIALEFAGFFNGLTTEVHVFNHQKKVLHGFDKEIRDFVAEQMSSKGIEFHMEESPQAVIKSADGSLSLKTNKGTIEGFSHVMFATGYKPNTKNLGLEDMGVKLDNNGAILVDEYSRTSVPSIWAVGDVTDRMNLTPVALMEGVALAKTLIANEPTKPDFRVVPSAVFSQPPIGKVGLTEQQALEAYGDIDVYTANFKPLKATLSGNLLKREIPFKIKKATLSALYERVFMKLIVATKTDQVVGLHMCGEESPEIVQGFAVAIKAGLTKAQFDSIVGVHPTTAEKFVTMSTPTRKIRNSSSVVKAGSEAEVVAGV